MIPEADTRHAESSVNGGPSVRVIINARQRPLEEWNRGIPQIEVRCFSSVASGDGFGNIGFGGALRPSQVASSDIIRTKLANGERRLQVVAPPGSGKTVLGLYVWSDLVRKPALVLSPNSAIQAQWLARAEELFELDGREDELGTDGKNPGLLTSLTYQSLTMPQPRDEGLDGEAMELWVHDLIENGEAEDEEQARAWVLDLRDSNTKVFNERRSFYRKKVRDDLVAHGNALFVLHSSAKATLAQLKEAGIGLIILDECHHLFASLGEGPAGGEHLPR